MAIWQTVLAAVHRMTTARSPYVLAAVILYAGSLWIVGARWRRFIGAAGGAIGLRRATLATLGGVAAGNLTPSSRLAGEACRIALGRMAGTVTLRQASVAALWDRLSEVPPIAVLAVIGAVALRGFGRTARRLVFVGALLAAVVGTVVVLRRTQTEEGRPSSWRRFLALDALNG